MEQTPQPFILSHLDYLSKRSQEREAKEEEKEEEKNVRQGERRSGTHTAHILAT